jgi:hypothetical protein
MFCEKFSKKYTCFEKFSNIYMFFEKFPKKSVSAMSKYAKMTSPTDLVSLVGTAGMLELVPVHA